MDLGGAKLFGEVTSGPRRTVYHAPFPFLSSVLYRALGHVPSSCRIHCSQEWDVAVVAVVDCRGVVGSSERPMTSMAVSREARFRNQECCPSSVRTTRKGGGVTSECCWVRGAYPILCDFGSRTRGRLRHRCRITG